jgi:hypothetical protein
MQRIQVRSTSRPKDFDFSSDPKGPLNRGLAVLTGMDPSSVNIGHLTCERREESGVAVLKEKVKQAVPGGGGGGGG